MPVGAYFVDPIYIIVPENGCGFPHHTICITRSFVERYTVSSREVCCNWQWGFHLRRKIYFVRVGGQYKSGNCSNAVVLVAL